MVRPWRGDDAAVGRRGSRPAARTGRLERGHEGHRLSGDIRALSAVSGALTSETVDKSASRQVSASLTKIVRQFRLLARPKLTNDALQARALGLGHLVSGEGELAAQVAEHRRLGPPG